MWKQNAIFKSKGNSFKSKGKRKSGRIFLNFQFCTVIPVWYFEIDNKYDVTYILLIYLAKYNIIIASDFKYIKWEQYV